MAESSPVFVVFGAAGGVGSALCRLLAAGGANLVLAGRTAEKLDALAAELRAEYPAREYAPVAADAAKGEGVDAAFAAAAPLGVATGTVNLAGSILLKPAHLTTDAEFEETLTLNLRTAFNVLRGGVRAMMSTGGSVVLVSTVAARVGLVNHEAIAAAKGGVEALVRSAAATYAARNIRVNAVAPGLVKTPLAARITGNELALKASTAMHPLGRVGEPVDVATPIAWLLGAGSGWVTGQVISVDGGMSTVRTK